MKKSFLYAFKRSIPILVSWIPVALAYGVLMANAGYGFLWTGLTSMLVYAGSLQFLMITFFTGSVSLVSVAVMSLLLNSRHIFYGLSFIERFRACGGWKYFLIYALSDESYSQHCSYTPTEGVSEKWATVFSAVLLAGYWLILSVLGTLIGSVLLFDMTGIDFAMTALFVVILIEQLRGTANRVPAMIALLSSAVCLALLGKDHFILPSLLITVAVLILLRPKIETKEDV